VHEAITLAPPAFVVVTLPVVAAPTLEVCDELHVKGTPVMVFPIVSTTVAVTFALPPDVTLIELVLPPVTESTMDWTAQVLKSIGWLFTEPTLANREVTPGASAVTLACPVTSPLTGKAEVAMSSVATPMVTVCQLNGPTPAVISRPWLKAVA
jgi:hypothetical protein